MKQLKIKDKYHPLIAFLGTRAVLFIAMYAGLIMLNMKGNPQGWRALPDCLFLDGWARWDSGWYRNIAEEGYKYISGGETNVVFFPLYPLLMRASAIIYGNSVIGGIIISNACFLAALYVIFSLVREKWGREAAIFTVYSMALFPFSFFFSAVYTESLFLLLTASSIFAAEKNRWGAAFILGFLSGLTRLMGMFIPVALVLIYLRKKDWDIKKAGADVLWPVLSGTGVLAYSAYLYSRFGDPLAVFHGTAAGWQRDLSATNILHLDTISMFFRGEVHIGYYSLLIIGSLFLTLGFIALCRLVYRKMGIEYALFSLVMIAVPFISSKDLMGMGRYVSVVFPCFVVVGMLGIPRTVLLAAGAAFLALQAGLAILFGNWYFVA